MFFYRAYNLKIRSEFYLPGLLGTGENRQSNADVNIVRGVVTVPGDGLIGNGYRLHSTSDEICLWQKGIGSFLIRSGREVVIDPEPQTDDRILSLFIIGSVLAVLLHQRGNLVLHASAVTVGDRVIAFVGESGMGKSTTAGAFVEHGAELVADDIVPIEFDGTIPMVAPGFPQIKLLPDAAVALGHQPETMQSLHPVNAKVGFPAGERFARRSLQLQRVYVLERGTEVGICRLDPQQSFIEMVRHSYMARLLGRTGMAAPHLRQCAQLINFLPIARLSTSGSLSDLPDLIRCVKMDCDPRSSSPIPTLQPVMSIAV